MNSYQLIRAHVEALANEGECFDARHDRMLARIHRIAPTDVEYEGDTHTVRSKHREVK